MALGIVLTLGCGGVSAPPDEEAASDRHIAKARDYERLKRYDLAEREYRAAVVEASSPEARRQTQRQLADALIFWGKLAEARTELIELVRLSPKAVDAWHDLGILHSELGEPTRAEAALRRAVRIAPRDPRSRIALAALLVNARRFREAEAQYRELLRLELPATVSRAVQRALELLARELGETTAT